VGPLVEVCRRLKHAEAIPIDPAMQPLFRDVNDQCCACGKKIDSLREVMAFRLRGEPMRGQAERRPSPAGWRAWARYCWCAPATRRHSTGLNFAVMRQLKWRYGYFRVMGAIALSEARSTGWFASTAGCDRRRRSDAWDDCSTGTERGVYRWVTARRAARPATVFAMLIVAS